MENHIDVNIFIALKKLLKCEEINVRNTSKPGDFECFHTLHTHECKPYHSGELGKENKIKK